jgi:hypothetical protein
MSATHARPAVATYRDAVTELVRAEQPFGDIAEAIDEIVDLTRDEKATLRRYAFSLHVGARQARQARPHLVVLR